MIKVQWKKLKKKKRWKSILHFKDIRTYSPLLPHCWSFSLHSFYVFIFSLLTVRLLLFSFHCLSSELVHLLSAVPSFPLCLFLISFLTNRIGNWIVNQTVQFRFMLWYESQRKNFVTNRDFPIVMYILTILAELLWL